MSWVSVFTQHEPLSAALGRQRQRMEAKIANASRPEVEDQAVIDQWIDEVTVRLPTIDFDAATRSVSEHPGGVAVTLTVPTDGVGLFWLRYRPTEAPPPAAAPDASVEITGLHTPSTSVVFDYRSSDIDADDFIRWKENQFDAMTQWLAASAEEARRSNEQMAALVQELAAARRDRLRQLAEFERDT